MRKFILQAINQFDDTISGNAAANVEFNVYNAGGGLADIYTNDGSGLISQTLPLLTDANGKYEFYADNGRYSILFVDETIALQNDLTDLAIYEYGSAGARDAATTAEAVAGTSDKLPDTIGVKEAIENYSNQFGVGAVKTLASGTSLIDLTIEQGNFYVPSATDTPNGSIGSWYLRVDKTSNANYRKIEAVGISPAGGVVRKYTRLYNNGVWQGYVETLHSGNLNHAQNVSGATVVPNTTVSGGNLSPARVGTWRNVSGNDILNNGYGLWQLV